MIERFIMIQKQADLRHEGRALGPLFQRLLRHLPGGDVASNSLDTDHRMLLEPQLHTLTKPDFPAVFRHGGKFQVSAGEALGYLSLVEALCGFPKIMTNQFKIMLAQQFFLSIAHDRTGSRIDKRKATVQTGRIDDIRSL